MLNRTACTILFVARRLSGSRYRHPESAGLTSSPIRTIPAIAQAWRLVRFESLSSFDFRYVKQGTVSPRPIQRPRGSTMSGFVIGVIAFYTVSIAGLAYAVYTARVWDDISSS
jgi:hypothetical protein